MSEKKESFLDSSTSNTVVNGNDKPFDVSFKLIDSPRVNHPWSWPMLLMGIMVAMSTSYQFGYNISVLNQPVEFIKDFYNRSLATNKSEKIYPGNITLGNITINIHQLENEWAEFPSKPRITLLWSLTTTLFVVGGMIGAFSIGFLADQFGRRKSLVIMGIPGIVGGILSYLCIKFNSISLLLIGRLICGLNAGAATQLGPIYMLEIVTFNHKGAMGTMHQLFITLGIFMGSFFGLNSLLGNYDLWPILLLLNCVPCSISILLFLFIFPESPRYEMMINKNRGAADRALTWLRRHGNNNSELDEMLIEQQNETNEKFTIKKILTRKNLRPPLLVAVVLQLVQQLSGINAIFFYSSGIYQNAGINPNQIQYANLITCLINVFSTFIALPLIDRVGRRPLLLVPVAGMACSLAIITLSLYYQNQIGWMSYVSVICVILYVIFFAVGPGPIPCMITSEMFRQGPRAMACSVAGLVNWSAIVVVAMGFEIIHELIKEFVFIIFLIIMILSFIFIYFKVPETKNKSFDEIARHFLSNHGNVREEDEKKYNLKI